MQRRPLSLVAQTGSYVFVHFCGRSASQSIASTRGPGVLGGLPAQAAAKTTMSVNLERFIVCTDVDVRY